MEWRDEGIILGTRRHGETSAILELMTRAHGRHMGLVRGGRSRRMQLAPFGAGLLDRRVDAIDEALAMPLQCLFNASYINQVTADPDDHEGSATFSSA